MAKSTSFELKPLIAARNLAAASASDASSVHAFPLLEKTDLPKVYRRGNKTLPMPRGMA